MSLDNIQLPGILIQDLYRNALIDSDLAKPAARANISSIGFLGKNEKLITIVVNEAETIYLPDRQLDFLMGVLAACKLTIADVALVNIQKNEGLNYQLISAELKAEKIFLFDTSPDAIGLPVTFPHYQVQRYNNQQYLSAPSLNALEDDRMEKSKLWTCLKQLFSI